VAALEGQPDDASDDGDHHEDGTDQGSVGDEAPHATAPAGLTTKVAASIDQATLRGGRTDTGG
jgi:hypothetical protein